MSSILEQSRAGAIVAIAASLLTEAPVKASVDAGGPLVHLFVARNDK